MDFSIELHMTQQYYFEMFPNQSNALIICLKISFLSDLTQNLDIEPDFPFGGEEGLNSTDMP